MNVLTESIFNLIPKPKQHAEKKPIYRSKYDPKAPITGSTLGLHGTPVTVGKGANELKKVRLQGKERNFFLHALFYLTLAGSLLYRHALLIAHLDHPQ
jgi:hypothetical protein